MALLSATLTVALLAPKRLRKAPVDFSPKYPALTRSHQKVFVSVECLIQ
jgi:hypothetical protein